MQARIGWIIVGLIIAGAIASFFIFYEQYEEDIWIGASAEAKRNPYLAAHRFLKERGVDVVEETSDLDFSKLSAGETVFLSQVDSMLVSPSQIDAALDWVQNGGFLVVGVGQEIQGYDSILQRLSIKPVETELSLDGLFLNDDGDEMSPSERMREVNRQIKERQQAENEEEASISENNDSGDESGPADGAQAGDNGAKSKGDDFSRQLLQILNLEVDHEFYKVYLGEEVGDIYLAVLDRITFEYPSVDDAADGDKQPSPLQTETLATVFDETGMRMLQLGIGDGTFTALSSAELWRNDDIGLADHALLLSHFIPDNSRVHFFYNLDLPSIWAVLYKYFKELILVSLVLLFAWLWRRGLRVQRVIELVEGQRRNFAEHLAASSKFLVGHQHYMPLIHALHEDIDAQMRPFYPGFSQLAESAQAAMLAERTELPPSHIEAWLGYCNKVNSQDELVAALNIGNKIRKKL